MKTRQRKRGSRDQQGAECDASVLDGRERGRGIRRDRGAWSNLCRSRRFQKVYGRQDGVVRFRPICLG